MDDAANHPAEVLRLREIRKSFGRPGGVINEVLHGIDLTLHQGDFCSVIGPSGSGKSTLLNIIGLLDRQTSGSVMIAGSDTAGLGDDGLTRLRSVAIGFVFQSHHLISAFTAAENVMMPLLIEQVWPNAGMRVRALELLAKVGLEQFADTPVARLSGGQQQRVAMARALAMRPALILADEPTGNLDTVSADSIFELMRTVNRDENTTFLIITHSMQLAERTDRIIEIVDGGVVRGMDAGEATEP